MNDIDKHWAFDYVGKPWKFGGSGPDEFDCWGFVRWVQRHHYGIEMSDVEYKNDDWKDAARALNEDSERDSWSLVGIPGDGDLVLMARSRLPVHIGVWIKANGTEGILHCVQGVGVSFLRRRDLRLSGWGSFQYYTHK